MNQKKEEKWLPVAESGETVFRIWPGGRSQAVQMLWRPSPPLTIKCFCLCNVVPMPRQPQFPMSRQQIKNNRYLCFYFQQILAHFNFPPLYFASPAVQTGCPQKTTHAQAAGKRVGLAFPYPGTSKCPLGQAKRRRRCHRLLLLLLCSPQRCPNDCCRCQCRM